MDAHHSEDSSGADELKPSQLLRYLSCHRVVICSSCKYAVPPHALERHLKEIHHLLRNNRRPFMDYASNLDLASPDRVISLQPLEFPVPFLPTQDGLQCAERGCSHLCVTEKRMRSHWLAVHERAGQAGSDWHSAPLQTFFRGNLLRYFTKPSSEHIMRKNIQSDGVVSIVQNVGEDILANRAPGPDAMLDDIGQFLLQRYQASTYATIAPDAQSEQLWQVTVVEFARQERFLMLALLAFTALHVAHEEPSRRRDLTLLAMAYQDQAMPLFRSAIADPTEKNCHAILVFAYFLVLYSFASDQQDQGLLLVDDGTTNDKVMPSWLHFLRNGCCMLCDFWEQIEEGPVTSLAEAFDDSLDLSSADHHTWMLELLLSIPARLPSEDAWPEKICQVYHDAAGQLVRDFAAMSALQTSFTTWNALRFWPMEVPVEYMELLSSGHPSALILLGYFCVLLSRLKSHWYWEGRAKRLLLTVLNRLDTKYHHYLTWPREQILDSIRQL